MKAFAKKKIEVDGVVVEKDDSLYIKAVRWGDLMNGFMYLVITKTGKEILVDFNSLEIPTSNRFV